MSPGLQDELGMGLPVHLELEGRGESMTEVRPMGSLSFSWWVGFSPFPYQGRSGKGHHMCFKVLLFGNRLWNYFTAKEKMLMLQAKAGAQNLEPP